MSLLERALSLSLLIFAVFIVVPRAHAQTLSLGSLTLQNNHPYPCASAPNGNDFLPGSTCLNANVSGCPNNVAPINLTFGWFVPANSKGTVVMFSGGPGTTPASPVGDMQAYAAKQAKTFEVVQVEWNTAWEDPSPGGTGGNILDAACRPATFLNFVNTNPVLHAPNTGMCAQGSSAGSAAVAYSMAWYGAASYLNNVELISGPVLSEIDQGCIYPKQPDLILCGTTRGVKQYGCSANTKAWTDNQIYVSPYNETVDVWSGVPINSCATSNASGYLPVWQQMSIVDGTSGTISPTFNYPTTHLHGWLCAGYATKNHHLLCDPPHCPNNSASEGNLFYQRFNASQHPPGFQLTGVLNCVQEEGIAQGTDPDTNGPASTAINNDMTLNCHI